MSLSHHSSPPDDDLDLDDEDYSSYFDHHSYLHSRSASESSSSDPPHPLALPLSSDTAPEPRLLPSQLAPVQPHGLRKQASLAHISVPSFSAFRNRVSSIPAPSPATARRAPTSLLPTRSPRAASFSFVEKASPRLADPNFRPLSLDSPWPQTPSAPPAVGRPPLPPSVVDKAPEHLPSYVFPSPAHNGPDSIDPRSAGIDPPPPTDPRPRRTSIPIHVRYAHEHPRSHAPMHSVSSIDSGSHYSPVERTNGTAGKDAPRAPDVTLHFDGVQRTLTGESLTDSESPRTPDTRPKSPVGRLGSLFGWKSSSQAVSGDSPTTTFSERSLSPLPSPQLVKPTLPFPAPGQGSTSTARLTPHGPDLQKANMSPAQYFDNPDTPLLLGSAQTNAHVRELEKELAQVSAELAGSIRREMELEDELDRLRSDMPHIPHSDLGRRSSDYFSDSGASSTRYPISNPDERMEQLESKARKAEQERAQVKVDMASRIQTELGRRRDLEEMVHHLEDQLEKRGSQDEGRAGVGDKVEELELTLDETRRRLIQERQTKDSFEDLYSATKLELAQHRNDRDNLRDEVVPQLKARVEGLEMEAADTQALMYENTRMQQELAAMREELHASHRGSLHGNPRFRSIAEEGDGGAAGGHGSLSRSNSLARSGSKRGGSIGRSGSVKDRAEGRQRSGSVGQNMSAEGVKELEDQRDALHKALKLLISRYEKQQREHQRAVKKFSRAPEPAGPVTSKRTAYHREVSFLKDEVTSLRKRTEDALEQKWQYEKGLGGLKMDLDRAEQETRDLRILLQERDLIPRSLSTAGLEEDADGEENLELNISTVEKERDRARETAEQYRQQATSSPGGSAAELLSSAKRMDELADKLETEVQSNVQLRKRLADAVAKGEREQSESKRQVVEMQKRLAGMEDSVLAAQQHTETTLVDHESEVRRIEEASSPSLHRLHISIPEPHKLSPVSSPLFHSRARKGSPLVSSSSRSSNSKRLSETSLLEASKTQMLERKVRELEGLLREAEGDMQTVVQRVNRSQLEVADLQTERDAAFTQMRKLQALVVEERERAEALMP